MNWGKLTIAIVMAGGLSLTAAAQHYSVQELDLPAGLNVTPRGLNNGGAAVGGVGHAHGTDISVFTWNAGAASSLRRASGSSYAEAFAINALGQVVGAMNGRDSLVPFTWQRGGSVQTLPPLGGDNGGNALAVNNSGLIAGTSTGKTGVHAVVWKSGSPVLLATPSGFVETEAMGMNDGGDVVGLARSSSTKHAVMWSADGSVLFLGAFGGTSEAFAVNATRQVAGEVEVNGQEHAFVWSAASGMRDIGVLNGGDFSQALAINGSGQVVGSSNSNLGPRAFLWTASGGMVDLNTLIPTNSDLVLVSAVAINDKGQILVLGSPHHDLANDRTAVMDIHIHAGAARAYLLTPQ
jgi:probable HAF family extracellular repeat protein